jgi:tetraacyldisaccharide 4'-kinase
MRVEIHRAIRRIWAGDSLWDRLLSLGLCPLSWPYGLVVAIRNRLYDLGIYRLVRLPIPVISVGNVTAGGTGKTPLVILLARLLKKRGYHPAVLSRGYGGEASAMVNVVTDGEQIFMGYRQAGDEPILIARAVEGVPVLTGPKRPRTGRYALDRFGADVLILDDGFQHRQLVRDLDIVLVNDRRPLGNGRLLPAGPLREPVVALRRAHAIVRTGGTPVTGDEKLMMPEADAGLRETNEKMGLPEVPRFLAVYRPLDLISLAKEEVRPLAALQGKRIYAFAGIGSPDNFRETLLALKAEVNPFMAFPDHHRYVAADLEKIERAAAACGAELIVTTEKDLVRLAGLPGCTERVWALRMEMTVLSATAPFEQWILGCLNRLKGSGA